MKKRFVFVWFLFAVLLTLSLTGCSSGEQATDEVAEDSLAGISDLKRLNVLFKAKSGSELTGIAIFIPGRSGVSLQINIENTPPGEHAVHVHEIGDCSADDGSSAGGHWNPTTDDHGKWGEPPHHLGDIGNITVGEDGIGNLAFEGTGWSFGTGEPNDVYGKSIIIHADADDFTSQPTGAAGGRIGCVEIKQK